MAKLDENPQHTCIHEDWRKIVDEWRKVTDMRLNTVETSVSNNEAMFQKIMDKLNSLDNKMSLTQQQNGYQDKDIEKLKKDDERKQDEQYQTLKTILKVIGTFVSGVLATIFVYYLIH